LSLAAAEAAGTATVSVHQCDVSDEAAVLRFRDEALAAHQVEHVDLVFANAAIGGGGSFINDPREQWERVFAVNWWGVLHRADVPAAAHRRPRRSAGQDQFVRANPESAYDHEERIKYLTD
jgi:NAD(P)-dependent dehydrogenase (short-subunit alcohol dehydrogenase family)